MRPVRSVAFDVSNCCRALDKKRPGHEADHPYRCTAEVKNGGAVPPRPHLPSWHITLLIKVQLYHCNVVVKAL
jgi:hypothetical protein